jgi:hypothetical protein
MRRHCLFPLVFWKIIDMLYSERNTQMRIDSTSAQPQRINELLSQQQRTKEVAGEKEPDGDWDDQMGKAAMTSKTAQNPAGQQVNPQGVGTKVNIFA